jgi:hypothetical protein
MFKLFLVLILSVARFVAFGQDSKTSTVVVHDNMNDARECVDRIKINLDSRRGFENGLPLSKIASKPTEEIFIEFEVFWKLESELERWGKTCGVYPTFLQTLGFAKEEGMSPEVEAKAKLLYEEMREASLSAKPGAKQREMRDFFYEVIMKRGEDHAKEAKKLAKERARLSRLLKGATKDKVPALASEIFSVQKKMVKLQEDITNLWIILEVYPGLDFRDHLMESKVFTKTQKIWTALVGVVKLRLPTYSEMSIFFEKVGFKEKQRLLELTSY